MLDLKSILMPTDFGASCDTALKYACGLADLFDAKLHVVHVAPKTFSLDDAEDLRVAKLLEVRDKLYALGPPQVESKLNIHRHVLEGSAATEIVKYAKENNVDTIIMGTHGRTGLTHILLGSVAERVMRHAPCNVIVVRPASSAGPTGETEDEVRTSEEV